MRSIRLLGFDKACFAHSWAFAIVSMLSIASVAHAQDYLSKEKAAELVSDALSRPAIALFTPGETEPTQLELVVVKKADDLKTLKALLVASIESALEATYGCWNPHHAVRVQGAEGHIDIVVCFHCCRGAYKPADRQRYWFSVSRDQEYDMNKLFRRYGLPGSKHVLDPVRPFESKP